ncbi:MAG TPA: type 1 glutamine amidotransferase, partial [Tianweitania sediminis]|nr:type 1 glutamine amidotransferase [Tianweitania sediminis]
MRVLAVQNYPETTLGQIETALRERRAEILLWQAFDSSPLPGGPLDALVVLGGAQNALADEAAPWFAPLLAAMRQMVEAGKPVLGVCLGSQLLARAFGAQNLVGATHEFGWTSVALTEDGEADPVLSSVQREFLTFQWHDDTFVLPRGGVRLAGNDAAHNQAFRIGRAGYGIQFHFEAD